MPSRLPDEAGRGPRKKPYDISLQRWRPITKGDRIWPPATLAPGGNHKRIDFPVLVEITPPRARIAMSCHRMLERLQVPLLFRFIHSNLVHVGGFDPELAHRVVTEMRDHLPQVVVRPFPIKGESESHLYTLGREAAIDELDALSELVRLHRRVLGADVLRGAGERYVRACFIKAERYARITQQERLGYVSTGKRQNQVDIMVTDKLNGQRYAVSVKNQREFLGARSEWIRECIQMAEAHKARPWIVASFATPKGLKACARQKVRVTVMGARIAPSAYSWRSKSMKKLITKFYPIVGGEPYLYIGEQRVHGMPALASQLRELDSVY